MDDNTPDVSTSAPAPEPTQDSPVSEQLQAPAAPAPQPQQLQPMQPAQQPAVTTPAVPPSPNQRLHSFVSSVLGGITNSMAGKGPTKYTTDPSGRVIADPNQPKETTGDKLRRIGATALQGLGAGAKVGQQKSGLAAALAGAGAGAENQVQQSQAQDQKAKQEAHENEEAAEVKKVRMHDIARGNALTASTYQHMIDEDQDRDPARKQSLEWAKSAEDAGVPVQYTTWTELQKMRESDPETIAKYQILPTGMKMVLGPDNEPIIGDDGKPKMEGQVALIDGLHNGSLPAPASFVSDLQKYGKYAGITGMENLKPGDDVSMDHFIKLASGIQEGKKKELEGWAKPELGWQGDKPIQINSNDPTQTRPFAPGVVPNASSKPEDAAMKQNLQQSEIDKNQAQRMEAINNAKLTAQGLMSGGGDPRAMLQTYATAIKDIGDPTAQKLLQAVPPSLQMTVLAVAAGDENAEDATKNPRKGVPTMTVTQLFNLAKLVNPQLKEQTYKTKQKLLNDFAGGGPAGAQVNSVNQFLGHSGQAADIIRKFQTTQSPYANRSINWLRANALGDKDVFALLQALQPVRDEYLNMIKSGKVANKEEVTESYKYMNEDMPVGALLGNLGVMGEQSVTRLDQLDQQWMQENLGHAPNLIRQTGRDGARKLGISKAISQYDTGGNFVGAPNPASPQSGQPTPQAETAPQTHQFNAKAWAQANPNKDVNAAIAAAQKQGYEVIQ